MIQFLNVFSNACSMLVAKHFASHGWFVLCSLLGGCGQKCYIFPGSKRIVYAGRLGLMYRG